MVDLIDRQAAIDTIKNADVCMAWNGEISAEDAADIAVRATKRSIVDSVEDLPSAQPQHKTGKWIKKMLVTETEKYISYDPEWYCACCGAKYDSHIAKFVNFCYVCGADMRGEKNETD